MLKQVYIKAQHSNVKCAKCDEALHGGPAYRDQDIAPEKAYCSRRCARAANPLIYQTISRREVSAINKIFNYAVSVTHVTGGQKGALVAISGLDIETARKQFWANSHGSTKQNLVKVDNDHYRIWMQEGHRDIILRPASPVMSLCLQPTPSDPGRDNMAQPSIHKYVDVVSAASDLVNKNAAVATKIWLDKVLLGSYSQSAPELKDQRTVLIHHGPGFGVYVMPASEESRKQALIKVYVMISKIPIGVTVGHVVDGVASLLSL